MQERRIFGRGIWMTCVKQEGWRDETETGKLYFLENFIFVPSPQSLWMGLLHHLVTW